MSRVAKQPVLLQAGVGISIEGQQFHAKGPQGSLSLHIPPQVNVRHEDDQLHFSCNDNSIASRALSGTMRSLVQNMVTGVSSGFERRLELRGVGYRAQMEGDTLRLLLGFSHPVVYRPQAGIVLETPQQTVVVVRGIDKQKVGQTAAEIRAFRPPEPYKGKGVRYVDEQVVLKEIKKK